jgi:hypothetical protein
LRADRLGELLEALFAQMKAGLVTPRLQLLYAKLKDLVLCHASPPCDLGGRTLPLGGESGKRRPWSGTGGGRGARPAPAGSGGRGWG